MSVKEADKVSSNKRQVFLIMNKHMIQVIILQDSLILHRCKIIELFGFTIADDLVLAS